MPSQSWLHWNTERALELDEIETAHTAVGGSGRGRRYATQQLNRAYALLLAAQFQGFCRDLHTESADFLVTLIAVPSFRSTVRADFLWNRSLDRGNANQGNIAGDFRRLGIADFWTLVDADRPGNDRCRVALDHLNEWRNAIAHQTLDPGKLGGTTILRLEVVRRWRRACRLLARSIDKVIWDHLRREIGSDPW